MPVSCRTAGTVAAKPVKPAVAATSHDTAALSASIRIGSGTTASVARTCTARVPTAKAGPCFLEGGAPQPGPPTAASPVQPWTRPRQPPNGKRTGPPQTFTASYDSSLPNLCSFLIFQWVLPLMILFNLQATYPSSHPTILSLLSFHSFFILIAVTTF